MKYEQLLRSHGELNFLPIDELPKDAILRESGLVKKSSQSDDTDHIVLNGKVYFKKNVKIGDHVFEEVVYIVSDGDTKIAMRNAPQRHGVGAFPKGVYEGLTVLETDHISETVRELVD